MLAQLFSNAASHADVVTPRRLSDLILWEEEPMQGDWWREAVIYQIYPRSYQDSGGDGVGDLQGIIDRLDHVAALGADAIWVSPFYLSPMDDFGYDVADHTRVDPLFGADEDADRLITEAHARGLKVLVDLVLSHTSDAHPWFLSSRQGEGGQYDDFYVWADALEDGSPPNNWLSIFGGVAWQWETRRGQYYLHNFLVSQPDLNYHNPRVREAALDVARHWLERGVDGFRLDAINFAFHDPALRRNPPAAKIDDVSTHTSNPYARQEHVYDKNRPEVGDLLTELRTLFDQYGAIGLGEIGADAGRSLPLVAEYTQPGRLQLCYSFDLLTPRFDADYLRHVLAGFAREASQSWPCWAFSNHDVVRAATRLGGDDAPPDKVGPLSLALLLSLRGTPCLYQGEELALTEADVPYESLVDPYGIAFWPQFKGRDGCRTPMPWSSQGDHAGFCDDNPWLPIPDEHKRAAVDAQAGVEGSPLEISRALLAMRRNTAALRLGTQEVLGEHPQILAFERTHQGQRALCLFNLSDAPARWTHRSDLDGCLLHASPWMTERDPHSDDPHAITLPPWSWWLQALPQR